MLTKVAVVLPASSTIDLFTMALFVKLVEALIFSEEALSRLNLLKFIFRLLFTSLFRSGLPSCRYSSFVGGCNGCSWEKLGTFVLFWYPKFRFLLLLIR